MCWDMFHYASLGAECHFRKKESNLLPKHLHRHNQGLPGLHCTGIGNVAMRVVLN